MRKFLLRLGLPAILALVLALSAKGATLTTCYAVCGADTNYYYVCGTVTGKVHGIDYWCDDHPSDVCVICTDDQPDAFGRVRKINSVVYLYGTYVDLSPLRATGK